VFCSIVTDRGDVTIGVSASVRNKLLSQSMNRSPGEAWFVDVKNIPDVLRNVQNGHPSLRSDGERYPPHDRDYRGRLNDIVSPAPAS
jgi:hypothetical protein